MNTPPKTSWMVRTRLVLAACMVVAAFAAAAEDAAPPAGPVAETALDDDVPRVRAQLVWDDQSPGAEPRVGVLLEMAPGWHVYAADPGETGLPTTLAWSAPGATVEELPWPEPERFFDTELELSSNGYAGQALLPAQVRFGDAASRRVRVEGEVLACSESCIPGSFVLERELSGETLAADAIAAPFFARIAPSAPGGAAGLAQALLLAFIGGLLLNGMPCVMPVLAIKALALAQGATHRREALEHGAAYAGGVLASMAALAAAVLLLRSGGEAVGWGFQFQEPAYIVALAVVIVLFAANLLGAFEIHAGTGRLAELGAQAVGPRRSFFDGLLTVALATPCSAPFLGTAAGFAMVGAAHLTFAIFLAIGVGLALPLTLVAVFPATRSWIPKPGAWMNELRSALGFVLLATAVWLVWILGRAEGADAAALLLAGLVALGFGAWAFGRLQAHDVAPRPFVALAAAGIVVVLGTGMVRTGGAPELPTVPWSQGVVAEQLDEGRPTFVYFTADWCLTCKVNERLVLADPRVHEAIERLGFTVVRGDWTRRDEALGAEIARLGRSGVPLYAVYGVTEPDAPELLPELLTVDRLLESLDAAAGKAGVTRVTSPQSVVSMEDGRVDTAMEVRP